MQDLGSSRGTELALGSHLGLQQRLHYPTIPRGILKKWVLNHLDLIDAIIFQCTMQVKYQL